MESLDLEEGLDGGEEGGVWGHVANQRATRGVFGGGVGVGARESRWCGG